MASTGVNVLRWSALAGGLFYGFSHQRAITATQKANHSKHEYDQKAKLIEQAKAEYNKQKNPAAASADNVITDVNSPQFDLEKFLIKVSKENP
ncbi:ATPase, F0 complex, subunit E [Cordyceps militaris CM01]|uniref:ATP synthase F(0) complex subunit e, mitochondrial n=2 Tax=Cordyceps militaris TaxID=73501 RepID=G3JKD0_CORMM|nr:ATPase, F0 complex, subunit E [Cordyceps militaris CM01]ATY59592.1 F0 subunit E [Cordyceps militaris]EGX92208.1 ATPase, F0 complex, subunit E [Cordyceps militaris CM01]